MGLSAAMSTDPVFTRERGSEEHPSKHQITVRTQSSSGEPRSRIWTAHPGSTHYKQHAARSDAASAGRVMVNINIRQRHIAGGGLPLSVSPPHSQSHRPSSASSPPRLSAYRVSCASSHHSGSQSLSKDDEGRSGRPHSSRMICRRTDNRQGWTVLEIEKVKQNS